MGPWESIIRWTRSVPSLLPDEEINQLNFRAGLQSGPKVVLILSRGFTQSKQPIACSFLPLVLGGLAFLSRTYDFLDDSASSSFPSNSAKCDCTLWFLCMFPFCLFHCDCQFPFVCMCGNARYPLRFSPTEQKATYHTGWVVP